MDKISVGSLYATRVSLPAKLSYQCSPSRRWSCFKPHPGAEADALVLISALLDTCFCNRWEIKSLLTELDSSRKTCGWCLVCFPPPDGLSADSVRGVGEPPACPQSDSAISWLGLSSPRQVGFRSRGGVVSSSFTFNDVLGAKPRT